VFNHRGTLAVINSTFTNNNALGGAGATRDNTSCGGGGLGAGGAIFNLNGIVSLANDTLDANIARGGAAALAGATAGRSLGGEVYNLAFGNRIEDGSASVASVTLANSILTHSTDGQGNTISDVVNHVYSDEATNIAGVSITAPSIVQSSAAFTGLNEFGTPITGTPITTDPKLAPLANNGGPTETMALEPGSPAVGAATPGVVHTDERGQPRPAIIADIGAYQVVTGYVVDTKSDVDNGDTSPGHLSLREALRLAANNFTPTVITFAPSIFTNGQATITLDNGTLDINADVTIVAPTGDQLTIDGAGNSSLFGGVFDVGNGVIASLCGMTITNGSAGLGGGITNTGILTLTECTLTNNNASIAGGIFSNGTLTLTDCMLANNNATHAGCILNNGTLVVTSCSFSGNTSAEAGGAISNNGTLTVSCSTFSGNSANGTGTTGSGGGALINDGIAEVINSTLAGNSSQSVGGAVFMEGGILTLTNDTIDNNHANSQGTGSFGFTTGGGLNCQVGTVAMNNTIVADNTTGRLSSEAPDDISGRVTANFSLVKNTTYTNFTIGSANNITGVDPLLAPVVNNGGPTLTQALLPGSPAFNGGSNALALDANNQPLTTDQRGSGFPRIIDGTVDIGAYEVNAQPVANAGGTYTVTEGGSIILNASASSDPGQPANTLTYQWDFENDGQYDDATGINPTFSAAGLDGPATITVGLRVTDGFGMTSIDTATIKVTAVPPTASVSGPTSGVESQNQPFIFSAHEPSSADAADGFTYLINWGDGSAPQTLPATAGNGSGVPLAHQYSTTGNFTVSVTATDSDGATSTIATQAINITPAIPIASVSGPTAGVRYQTQAFTFSATDTAAAEEAAGFTYTINWGDGSAPQNVPATAGNGTGVTLDHQYSTAGSFTVSVTATANDGTASSLATQNISISPAALLGDPMHPGQNALFISGTAGSDIIHARQVNTGYAVVVRTGTSIFTSTFAAPVSRIVVYTGDGNDTVRFNQNVVVPTWIYGGAGNDNLQGAVNALNVIVGGAGNNVLHAGSRRDILIGGSGSDKLFGSTSQDLLIAGTTSFDQNEAALNALQLEWNAHRSYAARVANLRGTGTSARNNGNFFLVASGPNETVFGSDKGNSLTSGTGQDWFFAKVTGGSPLDTIVQHTPSEDVDNLS
jgi:hypothetical protein